MQPPTIPCIFQHNGRAQGAPMRMHSSYERRQRPVHHRWPCTGTGTGTGAGMVRSSQACACDGTVSYPTSRIGSARLMPVLVENSAVTRCESRQCFRQSTPTRSVWFDTP